MFDLGMVLGLMNPDTSKKPDMVEEKKNEVILEDAKEDVALELEPEVKVEVVEPAEEVAEELKVEDELVVEEPVAFVSKNAAKRNKTKLCFDF